MAAFVFSSGCENRDANMAQGIFRDLTGQRFGNLTAVEHVGSDKHRNALWRCVCDCGREHVVASRALVNGHVKTCGCFKSGKFRNRQGQEHHGGSGERLYGVWIGMLNRCYDKNVRCYPSYGGRGIRVCDEWFNSYAAFREWANANGYDPSQSGRECSLDRINVDGDYEPSNCRFVSMNKQMLNRTDNRWLVYRGQRITLTEASKIGGITCGTIRDRIARGWTVERAVEQPARKMSNGNASRVA